MAEMKNCTLAIHIAQKDWECDEWRGMLAGPLGMDDKQIQDLLDSGERFGRGVVAGSYFSFHQLHGPYLTQECVNMGTGKCDVAPLTSETPALPSSLSCEAYALLVLGVLILLF